MRSLNNMGIKATIHHHEVAPNQAEISTASLKPIDLGDNILTIKYVAKHIAREEGFNLIAAKFTLIAIAGEHHMQRFGALLKEVIKQ